MSIDARLSKLIPSLSAKERAIMVLRSLQAGTPEDPLWRSTMPREQSAQFNHYIALMNACNIHLPLYITMVEQHTEQLWLRVFWLQSIMEAGRLFWELGKLVPAGKRSAAQAVVAGSFPVVELPWDGEEHRHSWLTISEEMFAGLRLGLTSLWQELKAIDVVLDEVAQEFDGEDPLRPVMRGVLEKARWELTLLHGAFDKAQPLALPEPDDEAMALARKFFDNGYQLMQRL